MELSKKLLIFKEITFRARKIKRTALKNFLMLQKMKLSSPKLKKLLIFQKVTCKA